MLNLALQAKKQKNVSVCVNFGNWLRKLGNWREGGQDISLLPKMKTIKKIHQNQRNFKLFYFHSFNTEVILYRGIIDFFSFLANKRKSLNSEIFKSRYNQVIESAWKKYFLSAPIGNRTADTLLKGNSSILSTWCKLIYIFLSFSLSFLF